MKIILALAAILSVAAADDLSDLKTFLSCLDKVLTNGLPSVGIPPHDPLQLQDYPISASRELNLSATNNIIHGLLNYTFPVLDVAEKSSSPDTVVYDYAIHWPKLKLTGGWKLKMDIPPYIPNAKDVGIYDVVLSDLTISGIFNLTKPGQEGYNETVNAFTMSSAVKNVEVDVIESSGFHIVDFEYSYKDYFNNIFNGTFPEEWAGWAEALRTSRFNDFWIAHPEKIQAIMNYCGLIN